MKNWKKRLALLFCAVMLFAASGCAAENPEIPEENSEPEPVTETKEEETEMAEKRVFEKDASRLITSIFPKVGDYWVGDVMPMGEEHCMQLYYLFDTDHNGRSYHPIWKMSTDNFYEFYNDGEAVPTTDNPKVYDIAIGTGSIMRANDGVYHCFYTGHNTYMPMIGEDKSVMMHAISHDNVTWTKIPEDTFHCAEGYSSDDFRDPFVFWCEEEQKYWMLISARTDKQGGVVARYTSDDLSKWELQDPLYVPHDYFMMECVDLFEWGGKWYMFFSWNCETYYAVADSVYGPFTEPKQNVIAGSGFTFYAAKSAEFDGSRYLCGWIGRKRHNDDTRAYDWAGNMCIVELVRNEDGTLGAKMPHTYTDYFTEKAAIEPVSAIGGASFENGTLTMSADKAAAGVDMGELPETMLLTCKVKFNEKGSEFGFNFGIEKDFLNSYYIMLNARRGRIHYDGAPLTEEGKKEFQAYTRFDFEAGVEYDVKLAVEGNVMAVYVEDQRVLFSRIYKAPGKNWGMYLTDGDAVISDIEIFLPKASE